MRKLYPAFLLLSLVWVSLAQDAPKLDPKQQSNAQQMRTALKDAQSAGVVLNSSSNVKESVNIEAVMLPNSIVRSVFGKAVADNYAVIEINVLNRNPDAAFILGSLYIDYSRWGLANGTGDFMPSGQPYGHVSSSDSRQVSSVEYRIIRGELLDRQPYTYRNLGIRSMKVLGSIGTAFAFPFSPDVVRGINAWNGGVVPGFEELFPDGTTAQMNRISDYGFRNNKVIPQQSADIVIAFFPIKRFLSPTLANVFKESPALFFDPLLLAIDPKTRSGIEPLLKNVIGTKKEVDDALAALLRVVASTDADKLNAIQAKVLAIRTKIALDRQRLEAEKEEPSITKDTESQAQKRRVLSDITADLNMNIADLKVAQDELVSLFTISRTDKTPDPSAAALYLFLNQISLSRVSVVVGGTMNVDEQIIPASISETCFDKPDPELWLTTREKKTCKIRGRFLLHGKPKFLPSAAELGISDIQVQEDASSSDQLTFTYTLKKAIDPPPFTLIITKEGKNKTGVDSTSYQVPAALVTPAAPTVDQKLTQDASSTNVEISGRNFINTKDHKLSVVLQPGRSATGKAARFSPPAGESTEKITLTPATTSTEKIVAGCYQVAIDVGSATSDFSKNFLVIDAGNKLSVADTCPK